MKTLLIAICFCPLVFAQENTKIPDIDIDQFEVIKEKCEKSGDTAAYTNLKKSAKNLQKCMEEFVDIDTLRNEVEESKKTGSMDEVFGKYCAKRSTLASCGGDFTTALKPCLNDEEKKALNVTLDVVRQLAEFACYRDGDRIAMFVAEGGVQCIGDHIEGITGCLNSTLKISSLEPSSLQDLLFNKIKCDDLGKLRTCVVAELEKCHEKTPANIVDALFKFIRRSACPQKTRRSIHRILKRSAIFASTFYDPVQMRNKTIALMKEKCAQNAPEGGFEAFTASLDNSTQCIREKQKAKPFLVAPVDDVKQYIELCVEHLSKKIQACLPDEEKYWPRFQFDQFANLIDFTYTERNNVNTPIARNDIYFCVQTLKQPSVKSELAQCFKDFNSISLDKEVTCSRITEAKTCFGDFIKKKCIHDLTTSRLSKGLFDALLAPCSKTY